MPAVAPGPGDRPLPLPQVSVVVPIYNGEADLPPLLDGLLAQTYPRDRVELLLVDNHSRDRTGDRLRAAAAEAAERGWTLVPLSETDIQSSYAARNAGIRAARGEWLAFTDADCRPAPDWLARLLAPFEDSQVGLVAGEIEAFPGRTMLERYAERKDTLSQKHTLAHPFCPYGQTANLAVRRAAFEKVGLFRPFLTTGGDADLCWRVQRETDWTLAFAPDAVVRHRHRATLDELAGQWRRYGRSNRYLHDLFGVDLMAAPTGPDAARRWGRWLLKEVPRTAFNLARGKADWLDLWQTPLDLYVRRERLRGQAIARLDDRARAIARLEED